MMLVAIELDVPSDRIADHEQVLDFLRSCATDLEFSIGTRITGMQTVEISMRKVTEWAYWNERMGRWELAYQGEEWAARHDGNVYGTNRVAKRERLLTNAEPGAWEEVE